MPTASNPHEFIAAFEKSGGTITDGSYLPRLARAQKIVAQAADFGIEAPPIPQHGNY